MDISASVAVFRFLHCNGGASLDADVAKLRFSTLKWRRIIGRLRGLTIHDFLESVVFTPA